MKTAFVLKRLKSIGETAIICNIRYAGQRLPYYTGKSIAPQHWELRKANKNYQRAKTSFAEAPKLNRRLDLIEVGIKEVYRRYKIDNSDTEPDRETLKHLLDIKFHRIKDTKKEFFDFFQEIIDDSKSGQRLHATKGTRISGSTIKTYITTLAHLKAYSAHIKKPITFNSITLDFHKEYREYLTRTIKLSPNSIGRDFAKIITVMNEATEQGLNTNLAYQSKRFVVETEETDAISGSKLQGNWGGNSKE
jgi:hypothetical protein